MRKGYEMVFRNFIRSVVDEKDTYLAIHLFGKDT